MSLLNTASLIVTPNGYKEGTLYSVIPSDGSGDMSVVRATTATRVNSAGLVELVPYNLFTYSQTFSNADWIKNNATVTGGQSGYDGSSNAFLLTDDSTNDVHIVRQTPIVSGQYTISVYAKANTLNFVWLRGVQSSANVRAWFNLSTGVVGTVETNGTATIESVGNGWYRCSLTIADFQSGFESYIGASNANGTFSYIGSGQSIYIQNAQSNEGTIKDYQKTETRLNIPRLDYSNGTCPSILVEPQRTNILTYSSSFDNGLWQKINDNGGSAPIITANYGVSPDGTQNADRIQLARTNTANSYSYVYQTINGISSASYTWSVWLKSLSGNPSIALSNDGTNYTNIVTLSNEWERYEFTTTASGNIQATFLLFQALGSTSLSADFLAYGFQLEAGSYPTSYIPTTSASVTRNADVVSKTGISSLIGQTDGTMFLDVDFTETSDYNGWFMKDVANFDTFAFIQRENTGIIAVGYYGSGALQARIETAPSQPSGRYKIAFGYKNNDFVMYLNGTLVGTDTSGTVSGLMNFLDLHYSSTGATMQNAVALWKTRLTNTQLAQLTTI